MIRILIADDHPIVRRGLKQILSDEPDMAVPGEARDAHEVLELVKKALGYRNPRHHDAGEERARHIEGFEAEIPEAPGPGLEHTP